MHRRAPPDPFDAPSRTVVVEPLEPPEEVVPLTAAPRAEDPPRDDDARRAPV